jgi:hypothetical protein
MMTKENFMKKIEVVNLVLKGGDLPVIKNGVITVGGKAHNVGKVLCKFNEDNKLEGILPRPKDQVVMLFEIAYNPILLIGDIAIRKKVDPKFDYVRYLSDEGKKAVRKELKELIQQIADQGCSKAWCVYRLTKDVTVIPADEFRDNKLYGRSVAAYVELGIFGS